MVLRRQNEFHFETTFLILWYMMSLFRLDKEPKCRMQVLQEREVMYEQLQKINEKELRARLEVI